MDKLTNHIGKKIINVTSAKDLGELCGVTLAKGVLSYFATSSGYFIATDDILGMDSAIAASQSQDISGEVALLPTIGASAMLSNGKNLGAILDYEFTSDYRLTRVLCEGGNVSASRILSFSERYIVFEKANGARKNVDIPDGEKAASPCENRPITKIPTIISDYSFLIGRKITRDIFLSSGRRLFCANSTISLDSVNLAKQNNKLVELTLYSARKVS